jgi:hypothetical protein
LALMRPEDEALLRAMLESAARHGYTRRQQRLPEFRIFEELAIVRKAIWADVQTQFGRESQTTAEVILRIDTAFTVASQGSLRGYFRPEFERRGSWPATLLELASEWTPLKDTSAQRPRHGKRLPTMARRRPWRVTRSHRHSA